MKKIRSKLSHQVKLIRKTVQRKLKNLRSPKLITGWSEADLDNKFTLFKSSIATQESELSREDKEKLADLILLLTPDEWAVFEKRTIEASSWAIIGNELGHLHQPSWAQRRYESAMKKFKSKEALEILRR